MGFGVLWGFPMHLQQLDAAVIASWIDLRGQHQVLCTATAKLHSHLMSVPDHLLDARVWKG